jgi:hypothetical protein
MFQRTRFLRGVLRKCGSDLGRQRAEVTDRGGSDRNDSYEFCSHNRLSFASSRFGEGYSKTRKNTEKVPPPDHRKPGASRVPTDLQEVT